MRGEQKKDNHCFLGARLQTLVLLQSLGARMLLANQSRVSVQLWNKCARCNDRIL